MSTDPELTCDICGDAHPSNICSFLSIKHRVQDKGIPTRARLTLPDILRVEKMSEGNYGVISKVAITKGTEFGPLEAKETFSLSPEITFPLKLFIENNYFTEYYLDTRNENECNWLIFVQASSTAEEQNLICYQRDSKLYYATIADIKVGDILKVWYSPQYAKLMKKELLVSSDLRNEYMCDLNSLLKKQQKLIEKDVWTCKFCQLQEKDVTKFAIHISEHYSIQLRKICEICKEIFATHIGYKKHLKIVHGNVSILKKKEEAPSKNLMKDSMLGGPLLNDILTDSMDNTNVLLPQSDLTQFDIQNMENQNILLDNDSLNLSVENLITANDNFNFDIDNGKEQHTCDICLKSFSKLKQLIQHLQMHTGKYMCPQCLIVFSRNENLKAHKCYLTEEMQHKCPFCAKSFSLKKYLTRHILDVHDKKYQCNKCKKLYRSQKSYVDHNCTNIHEAEKEKFPCPFCNKTFLKNRYLTKHMKLHNNNNNGQDEKIEDGKLICEICATAFNNLRNLQRHKSIHTFRKVLNCKYCDKQFAREDSLCSHISVYHTTNEFPCDVCNKKFKSKKYLYTHKAKHSSKNYHCSTCPAKFLSRGGLSRHIQSKHADTTPTPSYVEIECYRCTLCPKTVKLKRSLLRHIKISHPDENVDVNTIEKVLERVATSRTQTKTPADESKASDVQKADGRAEGALEFELDTGDVNEQEKQILDLGDIEVDLGKALSSDVVVPGQLDVADREVCVSIPQFNDPEQNITLGDNAFILENGTIVEPLEQGNYVFYVLDKQLP